MADASRHEHHSSGSAASNPTPRWRHGPILAAAVVLLVTSFLVSSGVASASTTAVPTLRITSQPANPTTSRTATVRWSTTGTWTYASLDGNGFVARRGSVSYSNLPLGTHRVAVKTVGRYGTAQKTVTWTIIGAPSLEITTAPPSVTTDGDATIAWTSFGATSVTASLNGGPFSPAASPTILADLPAGEQTIIVRAANAAGVTTDEATWIIEPEASEPDVTPPSDPLGDPVPPPVGSGTLPEASSVAPPQAPASYGLPAGAIRVTTMSELQTALISAGHDIVLADGIYDSTSYLTVDGAHNLYAEHVGGAILRVGLAVGSNWTQGGAVIRGLTFNVTDPAKVFQGGIITTWGPGGTNTQVLDSVFRGNRAIPFGLWAYNPAGLVAQRLEFYDFTDVALRASNNQGVGFGGSTPTVQTITDIRINGVTRSAPGSSNGTAEAGLWIGHPVAGGVHRIWIRNVSWSGIETVNNSWNTSFTDLDIDMSGPNASSGTAIYLEHYNYNNVFQNFAIGGSKMGIVAEWDDPEWGGVAASHNTTIRDGTIDATGAAASKTWGVYLDRGTESTTITGVVFRNQSFAAIGAFGTTGTNVFQGNDTSGILSGAKAVSTVHYSSLTP